MVQIWRLRPPKPYGSLLKLTNDGASYSSLLNLHSSFANTIRVLTLSYHSVHSLPERC